MLDVFNSMVAILQIADVKCFNPMVAIWQIADADGKQFEIPREAVDIEKPPEPPSPETRMYDVTYVQEPQFGIKVTRRDTGSVV